MVKKIQRVIEISNIASSPEYVQILEIAKSLKGVEVKEIGNNRVVMKFNSEYEQSHRKKITNYISRWRKYKKSSIDDIKNKKSEMYSAIIMRK